MNRYDEALVHARQVALVVLTAATALVDVAHATEADPRIWLAPCRAVADAYKWELDLQARQNAILHFVPPSAEWRLLARVEVAPAFGPDWTIRVYDPGSGSCAVTAVIASKNIFYANLNPPGSKAMFRAKPVHVPSAVYVAQLPCTTAKSVASSWHALLNRLRVPQPEDPMIADGVSYTALARNLCGETHSPPRGSPAARFAELADLLRKFAETVEVQQAAQERRALIEKIDRLALELAKDSEGQRKQ